MKAPRGTAETAEGLLTPEPVAEALERRAERDELYERVARLSAEFANFRRRAERDAADRASRVVDDLLLRLAGVLDHLDLALASSEGRPEDGAKDRDAALLEGLRLIRAEMAGLFAQAGAREVSGEGEPFDPKTHEAIATEDRADRPPGTVVATFRSGWVREDRVLRAAQVKVSRLPEATAGTTSTEEGTAN